MKNKRQNYATALYTLVCGAYLDFYSWSLLQQNQERPNNAFLQSCFASLSRSFPLQVAMLFDESGGSSSIRKYLLELDKSSMPKDKELSKTIKKLLLDNDNKLNRLRKRRGNDFAHTNFEIIEEILNKTPKEKRGNKSKESVITGKEIIELLLLGEKIVKAIILLEMNKLVDPQNKIFPIIKIDFEKILRRESSNNSG